MPNDKEKVKLKVEHGYTYSLRIPKTWVRELGLLLASEVYLEKIGNNPLAWEIRIKPVQLDRAKTE